MVLLYASIWRHVRFLALWDALGGEKTKRRFTELVLEMCIL